MPRKINEVTKQTLESVPLPNHASTYTVISHKSIIDYAYQELANQGFGISSETYKSTLDGQIARGIHTLHFNSDPELSMMFGWTNSYNKQVRFQCVVGAYVNNNGSIMVSGEMGTYARKHTGTADADVVEHMKNQITNAYMYYNQLVADKERMKTINLTTKQQAQLLGVLFAEYEILTTEQASSVRQQMGKPSFFYNGGKDTLWAFYNHVTVALQESHPKTWMEDQRMLHWVITNEFNLNAPVQEVVEDVDEVSTLSDPLDNNYGQPENQTNLLVQIAEATGDESVLQVQYPLTPEDAFPPIQEEVESGAILHQSEDIEIPFDIDANDELNVKYMDPLGNTFEAPVVTMDVVDLNETTKMAVVITEEETKEDDDDTFDISFDLSGDDDDSFSLEF